MYKLNINLHADKMPQLFKIAVIKRIICIIRSFFFPQLALHVSNAQNGLKDVRFPCMDTKQYSTGSVSKDT